MKLQISFDSLDIEHNLEVARQVAQYSDILEIGTLPIFKYGTAIIERFRKEFPDKTLFADTKIIDRGRDVASIFSLAGADWLSVVAGTSREVIHGVCSKGHDLGKKIILDLIDAGAPAQEALEAKSLGVDALLFHQPYDKGESLLFLDQWEIIRGNTTLPIFVSAKIGRENIDQILSIKPDGIVIGKAIMDSNDPSAEAKFFYDKCKSSS